MVHISDTQVKPIVGNKAIEDIDKIPFKEQNLTFPVLSLENVGKLSQSELEIHLTQASETALNIVNIDDILISIINLIVLKGLQGAAQSICSLTIHSQYNSSRLSKRARQSQYSKLPLLYCVLC